tara:strand:+ start:87 stop:350 length:264 start_codon:yes stop_codon:yes gene_type:complete
MIKTRILEKRFGNVSRCAPQVFKEKRFGFLFYWCWEEWVDIGQITYESTFDSQREQCMKNCKEVISQYMIEQGNYAEFTHWYPEVQK